MKKNDETSKKNNKKKEKQKKVATSEEKENAAEKERKRLERQRANEEREKERRALAERNNNLLDQMNAFANGSDLDDVREFGQLNTHTSEFEELGNIPDLTPVAIESDEDPFTSDVVWECGQINTGSCNISDNIPLPAPVTPQHRSTIRQLKKNYYRTSKCFTTPRNNNSTTARYLDILRKQPTGRNTTELSGKNPLSLVKFYFRREEVDIQANCGWEMPQSHLSYPFAGPSGKNTINLAKFFLRREELDTQTHCGWEMP